MPYRLGSRPSVTNCWQARRISLCANVAVQADVDRTIDVRPLFSGAQLADQLVECGLVSGCVFEPGQKVEGFVEIMTVMQATGDAWQIPEAASEVVRAFFEDLSTPAGRQAPPCVRLPDGNQSGARRLAPPERRRDLVE